MSYPCDPMDCSLPGSSFHGIPQEEYWSGLPFPSPGDLPNPGIESMSPALAGRFRRAPGKPHIYPCPETEASKISPFGTGIQKVLNSNIVLRPILYVHMCLCVPTQGVFTMGQLCQGGTWERAGKRQGF